MTLERTYTISEIKELVEILQYAPDISPERLAGMMELVGVLNYFAHKTDREIEAETIKTYRQLSAAEKSL